MRKDFLLVGGAWHGAWCWREVAGLLRAQGHNAHMVTLTGLGERVHLMSPLITLETHIADVMNAIEAEELRQVVLVVHSYAGMLGTAVADRMTARIARLVYVDAVVPEPGESWGATQPGATREARLAAAQASPDYAIAPADPAAYGLAGEALEWVRRRQVPHPGHTYMAPLQFDPARVAAVPRTYVDCRQPALATIDPIRQRVRDPAFWGGAWQGGGGVQVVDMATGHDPMVSEPQALARLLMDRG